MKTLRDSLRSKDFVLTAEIPLHPNQTVAELNAMFETLRPCVDAIQVGDNDDAEGHIAPLAIARIALDAGLDPVVHLSGRDRNRIALQSEILGSAALGITSLVLKRGEKLPAALKGRVKGVFDLRATQFLATASRISENAELVGPPGFLLGTFVTVIEPDSDWQAQQVFEKIEAGARLLQTRPCLDTELLESYAASLVSLKVPHRASFIVTIPLLASVPEATTMLDRFGSAAIPEAVVGRLAGATDAGREGVEILAEALSAVAQIPGVSGANLKFSGDAAAVRQAIQQSGLEPC